MELRNSTVRQRFHVQAEIISEEKQIRTGITLNSINAHNDGKVSLSDLTDDNPELNNNSIKCINNYEVVDNYGERLSIDELGARVDLGYGLDPKGKLIYIGIDAGKQQPPEALYLGQATTKRRLLEADNCTTESHQSSSSSLSTLSNNVPNPTTCDCNNNHPNVSSDCTAAKPTIEAEAGQRNLLRSTTPLELTAASRYLGQPRTLMSLGQLSGGKNVATDKHMPWFGIDVGGTLIKVVFFDPKDATREELATLKRIRRYLKSSKAYGTTGKRDTHLEMPNCVMNKREGSLHFIRFATSQMPDFLALAKDKRLAETIDKVCATGGGAFKFEDEIKTSLGITLNKTDELDSIIYGIHYIDKYNAERECYFLEDPLDDAKCVKVPYDFSQPYPYLVVNIGSGVSILAVYSSTSYSRISGSSIGGGTFLGLCSLLTDCETFDEAIQLAEAGSSAKIDKLVKDIYGGDYPKFNLSGSTVACNFGHMNLREKHKEVSRADLARALLEMVTINIGSIARMCAANENIDRVVFIGNFLRVNQLSMKLLSYAVNYWSKGAIKALFLEHEGYFGAVGCFVESTQGH